MAESVRSDASLDRATDPEYAAICPLAVVGLIASVLGVSAFVAAPLVAGPVAGLVVSAWAWRRIGRSRGVLTGRRLAAAGMAVGAVLALGSAGWHTASWQRERAELEDLKSQALDVADRLLEGRYDEVYELIPAPLRERQAASAELFRLGASLLLEGAGPVVDRSLTSLRIVEREDGQVQVPAVIRVRLERRIVDLTLVFAPGEEGGWDLTVMRGNETFESIARYRKVDGTLRAPSPPEPEGVRTP